MLIVQDNDLLFFFFWYGQIKDEGLKGGRGATTSGGNHRLSTYRRLLAKFTFERLDEEVSIGRSPLVYAISIDV